MVHDWYRATSHDVIFRRRQGALRCLSVLIAFLLQIGSVIPVSASVIYCIGEDGHSGFELVKAGATGCADCCHEEESASTAVAPPLSECTDIVMTSTTAVSGGPSRFIADAAQFPFDALASPVSPPRPGVTLSRRLDPPRSAPMRLRRQTVLLI